MDYSKVFLAVYVAFALLKLQNDGWDAPRHFSVTDVLARLVLVGFVLTVVGVGGFYLIEMLTR